MHDEHDFGALALGFVLGAIIFTVIAIFIRDRGRDDCEKDLPRVQKCVQQWVPEVKP